MPFVFVYGSLRLCRVGGVAVDGCVVSLVGLLNNNVATFFGAFNETVLVDGLCVGSYKRVRLVLLRRSVATLRAVMLPVTILLSFFGILPYCFHLNIFLYLSAWVLCSSATASAIELRN